MKRVTGIGGIFFKAKDAPSLQAWYKRHLGNGATRSVSDFDRAIALKPDFRYAYINRANARLPSHPWLASQDFQRAGMYPERTVAMLGGAILVMIVGIAWIRRRHIRSVDSVA